ncbi:MAG: cysteine--tRNA ligase, partial [Spirochaetales bacterium]|nr:cysteine--tRNA ligase [Spirochaetales bacterium]
FERVLQLKKETDNIPSSEIGPEAKPYITKFQDHISNDLNTPRVLAELWLMLKDNKVSAADKLALVYEFDKILGFNVESLSVPEIKEEAELDQDSMFLLDARNTARKEKDWKRADELRDELLARGIVIKDTPNGTVWSRNV